MQLKKQTKLINKKHIILPHSNIHSHTSLIIHQKLRELDWEILMILSYRPNIELLRITCPNLCRTFPTELSWFQKKPTKTTWLSFLIRNHRHSSSIATWFYLKNGDILSIIMELIWFKEIPSYTIMKSIELTKKTPQAIFQTQ